MASTGEAQLRLKDEFSRWSYSHGWLVNAGSQLDRLELLGVEALVILHVVFLHDLSQLCGLRVIRLLICSSRSPEMQKQNLLDLLKA